MTHNKDSKRTWIFHGLIVLATTLPGLICLLAKFDPVEQSARGNVANFLGSFSFTLLGFLATIITVLFSVSHTRVFKRYAAQGSFSGFMTIYFTTIVTLFITFGFSSWVTGQPSSDLLRYAVAAFVANVWQLILVLLIISKLFWTATHEAATNA